MDKGIRMKMRLGGNIDRLLRGTALLGLSALMAVAAYSQQIADPNFKPVIKQPAYAKGRGPLVLVDAAHNNFHTVDGRYQPFAELLRRDGYVVRGSNQKFSLTALKGAKVLVISNALSDRNVDDWSLPTPSAFTDEEIAAVRDWVNKGGSLFLIADHMPMAGAAQRLGEAFGVQWSNGFAVNEKVQSGGQLVFKRSDGGLKDHTVTRGRSPDERVDTVVTFTGSAFQLLDKRAEPLVVLPPQIVSLMPKVAWEFKDDTPRQPVGGWSQLAVMKFGKGHIAFSGEAAMFSAQVSGPNRRPMGMNSPDAPQNVQFLLNLVHWLTGALK
jgi:hypothetical protein